MVKALRVVLIVYGAILLLMGLGGIIIPDQVSGLFGIEEITDDIMYLAAIVSTFSLSIGIWLIIVGRDPLGNIYWVKFAITKAILFVVVEAYLIIKGYVGFNQIGVALILDAVFAVDLALALAGALLEAGISLITGGTDNHMLIVDTVESFGIDGRQAQEALDGIPVDGGRKLLIDFTALDYISSAGLRVLLATAKRLSGAKGALRLFGLNETVREVFDISGFSTIFAVFATEADALRDS